MGLFERFNDGHDRIGSSSTLRLRGISTDEFRALPSKCPPPVLWGDRSKAIDLFRGPYDGRVGWPALISGFDTRPKAQLSLSRMFHLWNAWRQCTPSTRRDVLESAASGVNRVVLDKDRQCGRTATGTLLNWMVPNVLALIGGTILQRPPGRRSERVRELFWRETDEALSIQPCAAIPAGRWNRTLVVGERFVLVMDRTEKLEAYRARDAPNIVIQMGRTTRRPPPGRQSKR